MYAYVVDNQVIEIGQLPETWQLKDGRTVSGFHLLDNEIHIQEGWLPVIDDIPQYDQETQYIQFDKYEILEDKVIRKYTVENTPEPEPPEPTLEEKFNLQLAQNTVETVELTATLNEIQRLEQAQANVELVELLLTLIGGM